LIRECYKSTWQLKTYLCLMYTYKKQPKIFLQQ
jgi:hypothetical protein